MALNKIVQQMRRQVVVCSGAAFQAAQGREEALAPFASVSAFVAELPMKAMDAVQQHAVTMALVREQARGGSSWASSLLIIAYEPLLATLCGRAQSLPAGEREQAVLAAFLEAVASAGAHAYVRSGPAFLAGTAQMNVMRELTGGGGGSEIEVSLYDEERTVVDPRVAFDNPLDRVLDHCKVRDRARSLDDAGALAVVTGRDKGLPVSQLIAEAYPEASPDEQRRAYRRALRARAKLTRPSASPGASTRPAAPTSAKRRPEGT